MRLQIPLLITFLAGVFMAVQFFVPHDLGVTAYTELLNWGRIIGAFALVLLGISRLVGRFEDARPARPVSSSTRSSATNR